MKGNLGRKQEFSGMMHILFCVLVIHGKKTFIIFANTHSFKN